jgi:hypothetical protein
VYDLRTSFNDRNVFCANIRNDLLSLQLVSTQSIHELWSPKLKRKTNTEKREYVEKRPLILIRPRVNRGRTMIDSENLRAASLYINNQLLSRGLLRDGQTIDFSDPEGSHGGLQDTMGRIISVVNDLILRRDVCAFVLLTTLTRPRPNRHCHSLYLSHANEKLSGTSAMPNTASPSLPRCVCYAPTL